MVAQIHGVHPQLGGLDAVFHRLHALEADRQLGVLAQPRDVVPVQLGVDEAADGPADAAAFGVLGNLSARYT